MRFNTLRAYPTRQLDTIAHRPPHRAECRRQAPAHFPMHRQRCSEQSERLEGHVRREFAHGRPRIVTETNTACDLLQIGSQRSVGLLQRRLERGQQARTRPQRTDQQIDGFGELDLDLRRPLFSNLLLGQVRDHPDESSRRDRDLDGQAREEPEERRDDAADRDRGVPISRGIRLGSSELVLALFWFGIGADHVSQAPDRHTPRTIGIPGPQQRGGCDQHQHNRKGGHESCSCVR